jgi:hypothetical protein
MLDPDLLAPRRCVLEPISEIWTAAELLSKATDAHLAGDRSSAETYILAADLPPVREWIESLWGSTKQHPELIEYLRFRRIESAPAILPKAERHPARMPDLTARAALIERFGYNCAFCGIPLIRKEVRKAFNDAYPDAAPWGPTNETQHSAFQCMWLQYDHLVPHSRGGSNDLENLVLTCAGCNYSRMYYTLEEVGLLDPRQTPIAKTSWDGLERFLAR